MASKNARKTQEQRPVFSKTDFRYWMQPGRLRSDKKSKNFTVQIGYLGERHSYPTHSSNRRVASLKAAEIYTHLISFGTAATLSKYRPKSAISSRVATIGEWISAARAISKQRPSTFEGYARALRKIGGDILKVNRNASRFGPKKGGSVQYRDKIESRSLSIFTPEAVNHWATQFLSKRSSLTSQASGKTTCNSTLIQARSLFSKKFTRFITLPLPDPKPFSGVDLYPRQRPGHRSKFDPERLLKLASKDFPKKDPQVFLAFILAISAGLRRSEIDVLHWDQVDLENNLIWVQTTDDGAPKTDDSRASVPLDPDTVDILKPLKISAKGKFVLGAPKSKKTVQKKWGKDYRAGKTFDRLIAWLRSYTENGKQPLLKVQKPIHELRKELGSLLTRHVGIYAAKEVLRHKSVTTTEAYYADLKVKPSIPIGRMLKGLPLHPKDAQSTAL